MAGGTYAALSGLRTRMEQLDRLASDIANAKTAGYKAERVTLNAAERPDFGRALQSAIDVAPGPGHLDFRPGSMEKTGRDLDFAIEGRGFFVVDTPQGARYTRNGNFQLAADGTVTTADGHAVQTADGPLKLPRNGGDVSDADARRRSASAASSISATTRNCSARTSVASALHRPPSRRMPRPRPSGAACSRPRTSRWSIGG